MSESTTFIIVNGSCVPEEEAMIPAVTSGLYYGAGCFETFLAEKGSIFNFKDHINRLNKGLGYLGISNTFRVEEKEILQLLKQLLKKNSQFDKRCRIRIQVSLCEKGGYSKRGGSSANIIMSSQLSTKESSSKKMILSETSVVPSSARPSDLKLSNMLHYRQAFREAEEKGVDDAVMVNGNGFVAESSIANIFWMEGENIFTPSVDCDILPGIMRNSIIKILGQKMKYEVKEGRFSMDELLKADLVWLTNSVLELVPVSAIENISFRTGDVFFSGLSENLKAYKKEKITNV